MALPQPPGKMRGMTVAPSDHEAIAAEALAAMDGPRQIAPFSSRYPRPYPRRRLSHLGPPVRIANGARRTRDRPQDRLHQPYYLGRIWRTHADVGILVRHDGARSPAAAPGSTAPVYAGALRRAAHRA